MRKLILMLLCTLPLSSLQAEEVVKRVSFDTPQAVTGGSVDGDVLTIAGGADAAFHPMLEIADPGITRPIYAVTGQVRYNDVEGTGYLQLDSHFGERGTYFTRTMAPAGPLMSISGSSGWRGFALPFDASGDGEALTPDKLSLGAWLPGPGTVSIRNLQIRAYADGEDPLQPAGQWFSSRTGAWIGAVGGGVIGLWGGLIGVLAGRSRARRFVLASANILLVAGLVALGGGIVALLSGQPYAVWFPLLLLGGLLVVIIGALWRVLPQRYEQAELDKMRAMDA